MRRNLPALVAAATIAAALSPSTAAEAGRGWWGPSAPRIIASPFAGPYVSGYYGYYAPPLVYYDYYQPAPVYYSYYPVPLRPFYDCRRWRGGYRYRGVC